MKDDREITVSAMDTDVKKEGKSIFKTRGFKYGTLATALTAALIVVVIAANMVLSILTDRYSWALDFTSTGLYDISNETKQVINSLDEGAEIEITVFYAEDNYPYYLSEPLKRFCNLSDKLNYQYIDPEKNPSALTQYGEEYKVSSGAIVVKCGSRLRVFNIADYFNYDTDTGAMNIYLEDRLAAGILYVTKDDVPTVYFLTGHGEEGYLPFMNLIANNGADVQEINLMTDSDKISDSGKLMVICNPTRDYSTSEIRTISDFLLNGNTLGRNIMYFSATDASDLTNLEAFIRDWGIEFNDDLVLDSKYRVGNYPYLVIPEFTTEKILNTESSISTVTAPIMSYTRSLNLLFDTNNMYQTQKLITSIADTSYSKAVDTVIDSWDKTDADKKGPHTLSAMSVMSKYLNNSPVYSYMFVSGSADMLSENYLTYSGNGACLMQIYKIMVNEQDDTIVAAQKSSSSTVVALTATQTNVMTAIVLIVVPLIFVIIGLAVYIRRRFL